MVPIDLSQTVCCPRYFDKVTSDEHRGKMIGLKHMQGLPGSSFFCYFLSLPQPQPYPRCIKPPFQPAWLIQDSIFTILLLFHCRIRLFELRNLFLLSSCFQYPGQEKVHNDKPHFPGNFQVRRFFPGNFQVHVLGNSLKRVVCHFILKSISTHRLP